MLDQERAARVVAVVGPTATGKSDWGIELSRRFAGEVVSADSRQVYIGMDIGTGKVEGSPDRAARLRIATPEREFELAPLLSPLGVPDAIRHWLLDVVEPSWPFTVAHYQKLGQAVIGYLHAVGRLPIVVGGTGLYVRALLDGLVFPNVPPNESIRQLSPAEREERLRRADPEAEVDWQNPHRVLRALEIVEATGQPLSASRRLDPPPFDKLVVGIEMEMSEVRQRIHRRLLQRLDSGMVEEVRGLLEGGVTVARLEAFGLEYRYLSRYLTGQVGYPEMVEQLELSIGQFARRQLTWFRKHGAVHWVRNLDEATRLVEGFVTG